MGVKFKLSICMIVKDEEKNLKRGLDSLMTLLEKPDVELIIVDTGSTDKTPEIASKYTSKLYFHEWENNFSAMRNISISYAKGEFIFIFDADEAVLNAEHIYEIISDKSIGYFNTLVIREKNLSDQKGVYTVLPQERIFRNDGEFRYEGSVHNQPVYKPPVYSSDIYIEHYGYMFEDKELSERKFRRTSTLLKEELEKNPESIYYRYQLAKSYVAHGDYQEALEQIRTVYKLISNEKKRRLYVFGSYAIICLRNHEYEEAIAVCKEGLEIEKDYLDLYYFLAESLQKTDRHQESLEAYKSYVEYADLYDKLPISSNRAIEMFSVSDTYKDVALTYIISELLKLCRYAEAKGYVQKLHDEEKRNEYLFLVLLKLKEFDQLKDLFVRYIDDRKMSNKFEETIEAEKSNLLQKDKDLLERLFIINEDTYSLLNRIRTSSEENMDHLIGQITKQADLNELPDFYADMFLSYDKKPQQLFSYLKRLQKRKIRGYVKRLSDSKAKMKEVFENYLLSENVRDNDFSGLKLYTGIAYVILFEAASTVDKETMDVPDRYRTIFEKYVKNGFKYTSVLYNNDRLRLYYNTLENAEDIFFIALGYARQAAETNDYKSGIRYFSEALKASQYMACYLNSYKDVLFGGLKISDKEVEQNGKFKSLQL